MRKLTSIGFILFGIMAIILMGSTESFSKPLTNANNPWVGKARPGFFFGTGSNENDYTIDLLLPWWGNENALFFFNPNLRYDTADSNEENLGLGYRRFVMNGQYILGGNIFWDAMTSENHLRYQQFGFGVEALSDKYDVRANYYHPYGTTKERIGSLDKYSFGNSGLLVQHGYEEAMKGLDAEVGMLVPVVSDTVETRVFAGAYWYDSTIRDSITGWKFRAEVRPMQILNLSLEVKDDDVTSSTYIGGYLDLPFSVGDLLAGENPFKGASKLTAFGTGTRPFRERMTDKVVRDRHVITNAQPEVNYSHALDNNGDPIDIIYVNADNDETGNGTYTNPYQDISDAEDDARFVDGEWIYVFCYDENGCTQSDVDLELMDDMVLWGQGYAHPLFGLGGEVMPQLDGLSGATVVTAGDNNEIMGLEITGDYIGIGNADSIENTNIHHNYIHDIEMGISIDNYFNDTDIDGLNLVYTFDNNTITDIYDGDGLELQTTIDGDESVSDSSITVNLRDNVFTGNSGEGADIQNYIRTEDASAPITDSSIIVNASNNTASDNGNDGLDIYSEIWTAESDSPITGSSVEHTFTDNNTSFNDNEDDGVDSSAYIYTYGSYSPIDDSYITVEFTNNTASGNSNDGIDAYQEISTYGNSSDITYSDISVYLTDNETSFDDNGESGADVESWFWTEGNDSLINEVSISNTVTNNSAADNGWDCISGNCYDAIQIYSYIDTDGSYSPISNAYIYNTVSDNNVADTLSNNGIYTYSEIWSDDYSSPLTDIGITGSYEDNSSTGNYGENLDIETLIGTYESDITRANIDNTFTGNTLTGSADDGIEVINEMYIENSDASDNTITDASISNYFSGNMTTGNSTDGIYVENQIYTSGTSGDITGASIENTFIDNDAGENMRDGVHVEQNKIYTLQSDSDISDASIENYFEDNLVNDNLRDGINFKKENEISTKKAESQITNASITNEFIDNVVTSSVGGRNGINFEKGNLIHTKEGFASETTAIENASIENYFEGNEVSGHIENGILFKEKNEISTEKDNSSIDMVSIENTFIDNSVSDNLMSGILFKKENEISTKKNNSGISNAAIVNTFTDNFETINNNGQYGVGFEKGNVIHTDKDNSGIDNASIINLFENTVISGNSYDGVYLDNEIWTAGNDSPITETEISNTFTDSEFNDNGQDLPWGDGVDLENSIYTMKSDSPISDTSVNNEFSDNDMSGNADQGVEVDTEIYTNDTTSDIENASINNTLEDNTANDNQVGDDSDGIAIYSNMDSAREIITSEINDTLIGNIVDNSDGNGINLAANINSDADVYGFVISLLYQGNVTSNNNGNGLVLGYDISDNPWTGGVDEEYTDWYLDHFTFDLGNGLLESLGNNSFYGNSGYALFHNITNPWTGSLPAENNYWGSAAPDFPSLIDGTYSEEYTDTYPITETDPNAI